MRIVDSYKYIAMPLSKFPQRFPEMKAMDLAKGLFPFRMNQDEFYEYAGPPPDISKFVDAFSSSKAVEQAREFLNSWPPGKEWNFKDEMHAYLADDVRVLRAGCLCYIKEFNVFQEQLIEDNSEVLLSQHGENKLGCFHVMSRPYFTPSSAVHALWRYYEMKRGEVFLLSNQRNARKTSKHELEWISYEAKKRGQFIQSALSSKHGQKNVGRFSLDGFIREPKTALEFNGCIVHYHAGKSPRCPFNLHTLPEDKNPFGTTNRVAFEKWTRKKEYLERCGFKVEEMWECEYMKMRNNDEELKDFLIDYYKDGRPPERLTVRHALRGGRVEVFNMLYSDGADFPPRKLYYIDINRCV